jgi:cysteine desulfurase family protein (TIGR01976 family)
MLNPDQIRVAFPALEARPAVYFDNPAGTQMARRSIERMTEYMTHLNSNKGGAYALSRESDALLKQARASTQVFLNAAEPAEIVFGQNMTSLTLHLSRSVAADFQPGDTIVVTRLDHDANIAPWLLIAEDRGCEVIWVDIDVEDGTLDQASYQKALERGPKLVAFGYASNALGTINPVQAMTAQAKDAGALVFIDAVQYAPHGPIDVQALGADFLACSSYKFYGPHQGILYGKREHLDRLKAYKVRPASDELPGKWETGTQSHEGIAGILGALEHIAWVGDQFGGEQTALYEGQFSGIGLALHTGMAAIRAYEYELSRALLATLKAIDGLRIYGLDDPRRIDERVPTFAVNIGSQHPRKVAEALDEQGIYVWDGNYYALAVSQRLGVEDSGGMVRIGAAHYNTLEDVAKLGEALAMIARRK